MKKIIAVVGDANIDYDFEKQQLSFEIGKLIVENGYILATGGMGGVMEQASKGAHSAANYTDGSIIGVLPGYAPDEANGYVDIAVQTGMGQGRNLILTGMAQAVIAVGGGAGTLNEVSAAWQMNKLIIAMQAGGWSGKLGGMPLDGRRDDVIFAAKSAAEAMEILKSQIPIYEKRTFSGIKRTRISKESAEQFIINHCDTKPLKFLGNGSEGFVFTDNTYVYKLIDNSQHPLELSWKLASLSETLQNEPTISVLPKFGSSLIDGKVILIKYPYEHSQEFSEFTKKTEVPAGQFIDMLKQLKRINWTLTDFKPQNLIVTDTGNLCIIDIGKSFFSGRNDYLFASMCRRAFVTCKLQGKLPDSRGYKKYLSSVNKTADFSMLSDFYDDIGELGREFEKFYKKVITTDKKDVLNPLLLNVFKDLPIESVFDYGSGYGDISMQLKSLGLRVAAYDPDQNAIERHAENYRGIDIVNKEQIDALTARNRQFDCVLCSLVLCHPLAKQSDERLREIGHIMRNMVALSSGYLVVVICNPLYTWQTGSSLQTRILPDNFSYAEETELRKTIFSSGRGRTDIHRPFSFYEKLFNDYGLRIEKIMQTQDPSNSTDGINNSDFMVFVLKKS